MSIKTGWKKLLAEVLKKLGLVGEDFNGKLEIELNQGGVRNAKRTETLK